ncbi:MAG: hypothetical protein H7263_12395 [Candidatus Sericytochromatia bacterium]|nr:hypothetical protein [Candidatus Sericytochromatia bacterium]
MKLNPGLAKLLKQLISEDYLPYSYFNKKIVDSLIDEGILEIIVLSQSKKNVRLKSIEYLNNYLFNQYNIPDLSAYIIAMSDNQSTRADLALVSGDSKVKIGNVFSGFLINSYDDIYGTLSEEKISLKPIPGSFIFINDYKNFLIAEDIIVLVIENFENFKYIEAQKNIFPLDKKLFVWRYQSNALSEWLSKLPNEYIHFGDFDLAGLNIYLNFRKKRLGSKSSFLIPENIENLLEKYGHRERYLKQLNNVKNVDFSVSNDTDYLAKIINKFQKSLEQEIFIKLDKT